MIKDRIANWLTGGELEELRSQLIKAETQKTSLFNDYADQLRAASFYRTLVEDLYTVEYIKVDLAEPREFWISNNDGFAHDSLESVLRDPLTEKHGYTHVREVKGE